MLKLIRKNEGYLFIFPALMVITTVLLYPLLHAFALSFFRFDIRLSSTFVGIENYIEILKDRTFWTAFKNTIVFTAGSVTGHLVFGMIIALVLNEELFGKSIWRIIMLIPWMLSGVVTGVIWRWIFNSQYGLVNEFLLQTGLITKSINWLSTESLAMPTVILTNIWRGTPFVMLMLLAGLQSIPKQAFEAAEVDGANRRQVFAHVIIPQLKFIIIIATVLDTIWNFKFFDLVQIMTFGGPGRSTEVLSTLIYKNSFKFYRFGYSSAIAMFMFIVLIILASLYMRTLENNKR
jgi:multiple sugar transport system permease protein